MSRMMDKPAESPDEDTVSQKSSGMSPADVKKTLVRARSSFMKTMQQVKESYAQLPMGQGSKVTPKASSPGTSEPPSPSEYRQVSWEFRNTFRHVHLCVLCAKLPVRFRNNLSLCCSLVAYISQDSTERPHSALTRWSVGDTERRQEKKEWEKSSGRAGKEEVKYR